MPFPNLSLPKTQTLTDTFASLNATKWYKAPPVVVNGQVVCGDGSGDGGGLESRSRYTLTNSYVKVEVPAAGSLFIVAAVDDLAATWQGPTLWGGLFAYDGTDLICWSADWTGHHQAPYNPVAHRFLRIKEAGGVIKWETSPDGAVWSLFFQTAAAANLVTIYITGIDCVFDNLN